jgi:hypothetical protein
VENGSAGINIGQRTHLVAGSDLTVNALGERTARIGDFLSSPGVFAAGTASAASSSLDKASRVTVTVGGEVILKAGGRLTVHATTDGTAYVSSAAPISLSGPAKASRAETTTTSVASVDLGNSSIVAQVVDLSAVTNVLVQNEAKGSTSVVTGGDVLKQNDIVNVTATISSGSKFHLKAVDMPLPVVEAKAKADGLTNSKPRDVVNGGSRKAETDLQGTIILG